VAFSYDTLAERVERLEARSERAEERFGEHHADLAVIKNQMAGIMRLLWGILLSVITAAVAILAKSS